MTHVLKGRLKVAMEEANKEKALKQVSESTLNEKVLELATVEQKVATIDKTWDLAKQKAEVLQGKLGETETKLAQVESIVSAYDKELADLKEMIKRCEQAIYNMSFNNGENSCSAIIFKPWPFGQKVGWQL